MRPLSPISILLAAALASCLPAQGVAAAEVPSDFESVRYESQYADAYDRHRDRAYARRSNRDWRRSGRWTQRMYHSSYPLGYYSGYHSFRPFAPERWQRRYRDYDRPPISYPSFGWWPDRSRYHPRQRLRWDDAALLGANAEVLNLFPREQRPRIPSDNISTSRRLHQPSNAPGGFPSSRPEEVVMSKEFMGSSGKKMIMGAPRGRPTRAGVSSRA